MHEGRKIVASIIFGCTMLSPLAVLAEPVQAGGAGLESIGTLSNAGKDNTENIRNMSLREAILFRLRAAHKHGLMLDVTEEQINSLTDEELEELVEKNMTYKEEDFEDEDFPQELDSSANYTREADYERSKKFLEEMSAKEEKTFFEKVREDLDPKTGALGIMLATLGTAGAGASFMFLKHQRKRIIDSELSGNDFASDFECSISEKTKKTSDKIISEEKGTAILDVRKTSIQDALDFVSVNSQMKTFTPATKEEVNDILKETELIKPAINDYFENIPKYNQMLQNVIEETQKEVDKVKKESPDDKNLIAEKEEQAREFRKMLFANQLNKENESSILRESENLKSNLTEKEFQDYIVGVMKGKEDKLRNVFTNKQEAWEENRNKDKKIREFNEKFADWEKENYPQAVEEKQTKTN